MRKLVLIAIAGVGLVSCTSKWEYKVVSVKGTDEGSMADFQSHKLEVSEESLNPLGEDGWELVGIYEKTETVHPNFGNDQYVSGIQPNVRTAEVNFVFKRGK